MKTQETQNIFKVGFFVAAMAIILMVMVILIGNENNSFSKKVNIEAHVSNAENLKSGAQVQFKGIKIGTVSEVNVYDSDTIKIILNISQEYLQWIKKDSLVSIQNAGLVGDKFIEVLGGSENSPAYSPSSDILYGDNSPSMKDFANKGDGILTSTHSILARVDRILEKIEQGEKFSHAADNLYKMSSSLEKILEQIEKSNLDNLVNRANSTITNLDKITRQVTTGPGTLHSLIYDDSVHDDIRLILGGAQRNEILKYFIRRTIKNADDLNRELSSQKD